ncbi:MAG: polyprenyl synthetase family protein [Bacteroidetes bacterium]|jgi:geranylgeranyl diphosphate synthase type II|nr:polyprenyl synthetase family protein [Bacteroidota bacterium]
MSSIPFLQQVLEKEFSSLHFGHEPRQLYEPMDYMLTLAGKRLRPLFVLAGCEMFGGDYKKALNAAIGIELFHNFTLLHDDIMDNATKRRNRPAVHVKWNTNVAILSGDALFVKACEKMTMVDDTILRKVLNLFYKTSIEVCEGQQLDMDFEQLNEITLEEYTGMITLKTAVLLACSLTIGSLIAGADEKDAERIYDFGKNIGIAFQIQDDLLDAYGEHHKVGKKPGGDIIEGKKTFLFAETCRQLNGKEHLDFVSLYNNRTMNAEEKTMRVKQIFDKVMVVNTSQKAIHHYFERGYDQLKKLNLNTSAAMEFKLFCEKLLNRDH